MKFDELVAFIKTQWPVILAVTVIVAPASWLAARWLHANRLEELLAEIRRLKSGTTAGAAVRQGSAATSVGVAASRWTSVVAGEASYVYVLELEQLGSEIEGTATVTRSGAAAPYIQPFKVKGLEFSGCLLLTLTSSVPSSTSAVSALLRITDRGSRLAGQWAYRSRQSDDILTEAVAFTRQGAS